MGDSYILSVPFCILQFPFGICGGCCCDGKSVIAQGIMGDLDQKRTVYSSRICYRTTLQISEHLFELL